MTTKQINKLDMYLAVEGICDLTTSAWQTLQGFFDAYADLKTHINTIQTLAQSQGQNNSGITKDKLVARTAMCALAEPIGKAVHAYALKTKNNTLAQSVDFSMSDLSGGRDVQSSDRCQTIATLATTNLPNLTNYGVKIPKLTALTNAVTTYTGLLSKPRDSRAKNKTTTANLPVEYSAADSALVIMDDLTGQLTDTTFISDYRNARIIVDTNARRPKPKTPPPQPGTATS